MKTFSTDNTGKWPMHPCVSYVTSNWDVEEFRRRQTVQVNPSKKKVKGKDHFSKQRKRGNDKKGSWNKTLCSYCGKSGYHIEKC